MLRLTQRVMRLCSDLQRIKCIDAINETILSHQDHQGFLKDCIMRAMRAMHKSGEIGQEVYGEMDQIFNPTKGVNIETMMLSGQR